jgi:hypothetical protein
MAKTIEATARAGVAARNPGALVETVPDLTKKVQTAIDTIKKPFTSFVKDFAALSASREELAPKFMKAFGLWQGETGGTFVDFVRFLVPDVGKSRTEYRTHRAYQAADYLRRIQGNTSRRPTTQAERAAAPTPPADAFARLMATLLSMIPEGRHAIIETALKTELHWSERQVETTMTRAENSTPLVEVKGRNLDNLRLTMPEHTTEEAAA